jgi:hypothetical protein
MATPKIVFAHRRGYDQTRLHEGRHPTRDGWDVVTRVNTKRDGLW